MFKFLRRFRKNDDGGLSIEAVLILPILAWCLVATFVFFDAFRAKATNVKAAYTLSDMLSRELNYVNLAYLTSLHNVFNFLTSSDSPTSIRLTMVRWDEEDDEYQVNWSREIGEYDQLNDATISQIESQLPVMPDNEVVIVFETWMDYAPLFNVGLDNFTMHNLVVTRPRFSPQLCWVNAYTC